MCVYSDKGHDAGIVLFLSVREGLVAGTTGNEEFWACLSALILQLTRRQLGLRREYSDVRSRVHSPGVVPRSGTLSQSKQCQCPWRMSVQSKWLLVNNANLFLSER